MLFDPGEIWHETFKEGNLPIALFCDSSDPGVEQPPHRTHEVAVTDAFDVQLDLTECRTQHPLAVSAKMANGQVDWSVCHRPTGNEQHHRSSGGENLPHRPQGANVVFDVFQHVYTDDRIDSLRAERIDVALVEPAGLANDLWMVSEFAEQFGTTRGVRFKRDNKVSACRQFGRHVSDAGAHLQDPSTKVWQQQFEQPGVVSRRQLHLLQVRRDEALMDLRVSSVHT